MQAGSSGHRLVVRRHVECRAKNREWRKRGSSDCWAALDKSTSYAVVMVKEVKLIEGEVEAAAAQETRGFIRSRGALTPQATISPELKSEPTSPSPSPSHRQHLPRHRPRIPHQSTAVSPLLPRFDSAFTEQPCLCERAPPLATRRPSRRQLTGPKRSWLNRENRVPYYQALFREAEKRNIRSWQVVCLSCLVCGEGGRREGETREMAKTSSFPPLPTPPPITLKKKTSLTAPDSAEQVHPAGVLRHSLQLADR